MRPFQPTRTAGIGVRGELGSRCGASNCGDRRRAGGQFHALHALKHAREAGRRVSVTIFEPKDFWRPGQPGCNKCAGLVPPAVVDEFGTLGILLPGDEIAAYGILIPKGPFVTASLLNPHHQMASMHQASYRDMLKMATNPRLVTQILLALGASLVEGSTRR